MKMNMTKRLAASLAFSALALFGAQTVSAADIVAGDVIKLSDGVGSGPGGEFIGSFMDNTGSFATFCLEKNEYFNYFGQPLKVQAVNSAAVSGGSWGGNPDPISYQTAWLYTEFRSGSLSGYGATASDADSLQNAFWYLENELAATNTPALLASLSTKTQTWVGLAETAVTSGGWNSIGNVRVLNLLRKDGSGNFTVQAQDQLYLLTPVPEPETYALMGLGLGLLGFVARRRKQQAAA